MTEENDEIFNLLKDKEDCPSELIELFDATKSDWRKAVIKQFIELHDWRGNINRKLERINLYEKVILGILGIIGTTYVTYIITMVFLPLLGV